MTGPVTTITRLVFPDQANHHGTLFGGEALAMLASAGSIAATRRARKPVVLAHSAAIDFVAPVPLGSIVETRASVTDVGRSSLRVTARLEAEDLLTGERRISCSGELVFVAVDSTGRPSPVAGEGARDEPRPTDDATTSVELVLPGQTNPGGALFGGELMRLLDAIAFVTATRSARAPLVTAHTERMRFRSSIAVGELVSLRGRVARKGSRSFAVEVDATAESALTGVSRPCTTAHFVFVRPRDGTTR